jgi:hypothetical protein
MGDVMVGIINAYLAIVAISVIVVFAALVVGSRSERR